jgi:hypothetical protein
VRGCYATGKPFDCGVDVFAWNLGVIVMLALVTTSIMYLSSSLCSSGSSMGLEAARSKLDYGQVMYVNYHY